MTVNIIRNRPISYKVIDLSLGLSKNEAKHYKVFWSAKRYQDSCILDAPI